MDVLAINAFEVIELRINIFTFVNFQPNKLQKQKGNVIYFANHHLHQNICCVEFYMSSLSADVIHNFEQCYSCHTVAMINNLEAFCRRDSNLIVEL